MANKDLQYRVRIATLGASTVSGNVDLTLMVSDLVDPPQFGPRAVDPLEGKASSKAWTVRVRDTSEQITGWMSDAEGRMHVNGRLVDISEQVDSGGWRVLRTDRLTRLAEVSTGVFEVEAHNERIMERVEVFKSQDTTSLNPAGVKEDWAGFSEEPLGTFQFHETTFTGSDVRLVHRNVPEADEINSSASNARASLIQDDVKAGDLEGFLSPSAGNFETLRFFVEGTGDVEVLAFSQSEEEPGASLNEGPNRIDQFFVYWPGAASSGSVKGRLHMDGHEPTQDLPYHLGGNDGLHPIQVAKDLYQQEGVRIDVAAFDALIADKRYPRVTFRIKGPERLDRWLQENIFKPFGIIPFVNESGEVAVKRATMPDGTDISDIANLHLFDTAELMGPPSWSHLGRDQVTRVTYEWTSLKGPHTKQQGPWKGRVEPEDAGLDRIAEQERTIERTNDRQTAVGDRPLDVTLHGIHDKDDAESVADALSDDVFNRYGDGPIQGTFRALRAAESVKPGDFVRIDNPIQPNPQGGTRGGRRVVQVVSKKPLVTGYEFEFLDGGAELQPLSTPTLSAVKGANGLHEIDITVSNVPAAAETWIVQAAVSATQPAADSDLWATRVLGKAATTVTVSPFPSGETIWLRVQARAPGRIYSAWSSPVSVTMDALSAPGSLTATQIDDCEALIGWSNADTDHSVELRVNDGSGYESLGIVAAGSVQFFAHPLAAGTTFTAEVRYRDRFGGKGNGATIQFTTTNAGNPGPPMLGAEILVGDLS